MARWYGGFRCGGRPEHVLHQIENVVHYGDLGTVVPLVRFQKRAARGEFYVFVAFDSPTAGKVPVEAEPLIQVLGPSRAVWDLGGHGVLHPFSLEEIRGFVSSELSVKDYARRIRYHTVLTLVDDPFDFTPEESVHDGVVEQTQSYDRLLLWLSAVGRASWQVFRTACEGIGLLSSGAEPRSILRSLRLLGHLECSQDGMRWSAAPSALVSVVCDDADTAHVLCGQRDDALVQGLTRAGLVQFIPQSCGRGPSTIRVLDLDWNKFSRDSGASIESASLHLAGDSALRLALALPTIDDWKNSLETLTGISADMFDVKHFEGLSFNLGSFQGESGFYELWRPDAPGQDRPKYSLFFDEPSGKWLRGDWYGLRYLALHELEGESEIVFDSSSHALAVPETWRWPELFERALVLASGKLPTRHGGWLKYECISRELVDVLNPKLGLTERR